MLSKIFLPFLFNGILFYLVAWLSTSEYVQFVNNLLLAIDRCEESPVLQNAGLLTDESLEKAGPINFQSERFEFESAKEDIAMLFEKRNLDGCSNIITF